MILSLIAAAMANTFAFQGGDLALLSKTVFEARKAPVAIFVPDDPKVGRFTFTWDMPSDFNRHLRRLTGCQADRVDCAYFAAGWPTYLTTDRSGDPLSSELKVREWAIENGVFMHEASEGAYYRLGDLSSADTATAGTGKPIRVHWFLEDAIVAVTAAGSLADALPIVAKAVGAKVVRNKDKSILLEPDPEAYRGRMIASLRHEAEGLAREAKEGSVVLRQGKLTRVPSSADPVQVSDLEMAIAAWEMATPAQIATALREKQSIEINVPKVGKLAGTVVRRLEAFAERQDLVVQSGQVPPQGLVGMLDTSRPVTVALSIRNGRGSVNGFAKGRTDLRIGF